jgi:hypothetical protein
LAQQWHTVGTWAWRTPMDIAKRVLRPDGYHSAIRGNWARCCMGHVAPQTAFFGQALPERAGGGVGLVPRRDGDDGRDVHAVVQPS